MTRYFFHTLDGQRTIDPIGTEFASDYDASIEAVKRAGRWILQSPKVLNAGQECRIEVSFANNVIIYSVIMFSVDPRSFGKPGF